MIMDIWLKIGGFTVGENGIMHQQVEDYTLVKEKLVELHIGSIQKEFGFDKIKNLWWKETVALTWLVQQGNRIKNN